MEKLNAQIDTWIDDENYDGIWGDKGIITLSNNAKLRVKECFLEDNNHCTHDKDKKWREALSYGKNALPVIQVCYEDSEGHERVPIVSEEHKKDPVIKAWFHLFYAKLLRARIQQKGSDCYTRRLDDVAAYLERHLPQQNGQDEWVTKLTLMYLLELSAASQDWESLGFAERVRRVIRDVKHSLTLKYKDKKDKAEEAREKAPYEFYDLWAHYNIGVAYFHQGYYRKAVLEFNKIIWQVAQWGKDDGKPENKENLKFFKDHHGIALLYVPAILFRAEVQLKLQFAYHSLDTLKRYFWENKNITEEERTSPKIIWVKIIETQACQQMGRLDKSWVILEEALPLFGYKSKLGHRIKAKIPNFNSKNHRFPNLQERLIDILVADHLGWLSLEGEDEQRNEKHALELRYIVKYGKTKGGNRATAQDYIGAVDEALLSYLRKLVIAFSDYFKVVKHHAYNRRGYFQQLARCLEWLTKAADLKLSAPDSDSGQEEAVKKARGEIAELARTLYLKKEGGKNGLLFEEDKLDKLKKGCRYCKAKGIDLRRIDSEHYTWFTKDMLKFFNSENIFKLEEIDKDKDRKEFVRWLIKIEREERDDLRIRDLELRYEYYKPEELLEELCNIENNGQQPRKYAEQLCWGELKNQAEPLNLLECNRETTTKRNEQDPFGDPSMADVHTNIMQSWDERFLHHLNSPSTHELPESGFYFLGLQRWNSASPAKGFSVGGGYLLYHYDKKEKCVDMGIAIDPGFDFVRNLFHMGFSLDDIDIVLLSHAHLDHIRDFESIVMLLSELDKRGKREKRVHVILSLGAYRRLEHIIEDPRLRYFVEPYIIDVDREIRTDYFEEGMPKFSFDSANTDSENRSTHSMERFKAVLPGKEANSDLWVEIKSTRAYHEDKTYSDSFGFVVELAKKVKGTGGEDKHEVKLAFGYTGDTKWVYPDMPDPVNEKDNGENKLEERKIEGITGQYFNCDVLLVHLGSLIKKNDDDEWSFNQYDQCGSNAGNKYRCEELVRKENHPYLVGMLRLLSSLYKSLSKAKHIGIPLVLVGEFGEELRGTIRSDFIQRLQGIYKNELAFLPVDVGLNVHLCNKGGKKRDNSRNDRCACKVWCVQCNHFVNIGDADFELYGADHALYCVCKTCKEATPLNVLQDRLRQLYEVGLELRPYESK